MYIKSNKDKCSALGIIHKGIMKWLREGSMRKKDIV